MKGRARGTFLPVAREVLGSKSPAFSFLGLQVHRESMVGVLFASRLLDFRIGIVTPRD